MPEAQVTHVFTAGIAADTAIDLSNEMPEHFDVRGSNDPIVDARVALIDTDAATAGNQPGSTDFTSIGQGVSGDAGAGQIVVTDGHTVELGDAVDNGDVLTITYEPVNSANLPT